MLAAVHVNILKQTSLNTQDRSKKGYMSSGNSVLGIRPWKWKEREEFQGQQDQR